MEFAETTHARRNQLIYQNELAHTIHSLSFVGRGFFSCVSVFFNLLLSKVVTPETSGLSPMAAGDESELRGKKELYKYTS